MKLRPDHQDTDVFIAPPDHQQLSLEVLELSRWMMDDLLFLRPFQQYFSHIRTMRG